MVVALWRSLGESNPCFSLERAKSIHLMIIAKRVLRWQTLSLLSSASLYDRPRATHEPLRRSHCGERTVRPVRKNTV
jgi:hypothetical protein